MDTCLYASKISAFYDGEMTEADRAAFEQHLAGCTPCQSELRQHRRLSQFMQLAPRRTLSTRAREDLYALAPAIGEGVYLRIAEWTTALAACILITASLWLFHAHPVTQNSEASALPSVVLINASQGHEVAEASDDPQLVDWISANVVAGQNQ